MARNSPYVGAGCGARPRGNASRNLNRPRIRKPIPSSRRYQPARHGSEWVPSEKQSHPAVTPVFITCHQPTTRVLSIGLSKLLKSAAHPAIGEESRTACIPTIGRRFLRRNVGLRPTSDSDNVLLETLPAESIVPFNTARSMADYATTRRRRSIRRYRMQSLDYGTQFDQTRGGPWRTTRETLAC